MTTMAFAKSAPLYAALAVLAWVAVFDVDGGDVQAAISSDSRSFAQWLLVVGVYGVPCFAVAVIVDAIRVPLHHRLHYREWLSLSRLGSAVVGGVVWALKGPMFGFRAIAVNRRVNDLRGLLRRKSQVGSVIWMAYSIALSVYLVSGSTAIWIQYGT